MTAAVGLPVLIAGDASELEAIATDLYRDKVRLKRIKLHLIGAGRRSPLFDTKAFARDLENLYLEMVVRQQIGDRSPILRD